MKDLKMSEKMFQKKPQDNNYLGRGTEKYKRDMKLVGLSYIGLIITLFIILLLK